MTVDGSDVKPVCVMDYSDQMTDQANRVAATVDTLIGGELCPALRLADVLITSVSSTLQFIDDHVMI